MPRILIVDDDYDFCQLASEHLSRAGYEVSCVGSAREANVAIGSAPPDLAIVDGFLSDRDGESWIAQQRRAGNRTPKVIFVSAFATYALHFATQPPLANDPGRPPSPPNPDHTGPHGRTGGGRSAKRTARAAAGGMIA